MDFGLFLLLQSPGARSPEEIFARGTEIAQAADRLGFDSVWCAEHHLSTYGYLSRPLMFAVQLAAFMKPSVAAARPPPLRAISAFCW